MPRSEFVKPFPGMASLDDLASGGGVTNPLAGTFEATAVEASEYVDTPNLRMTEAPDAMATIEALGLGVNMHLKAADGDASHEGGDLTIFAGSDPSGGSAGGDVNIRSGSSPGVGLAGESGSINILVGGTDVADGDAGQIIIQSGASVDGAGGDISLIPGFSTNGAQGLLRLYDSASTQGAHVNAAGFMVLDKVGFYGTTPITKPQVAASPTLQGLIDKLILLGLISQAV